MSVWWSKPKQKSPQLGEQTPKAVLAPRRPQSAYWAPSAAAMAETQTDAAREDKRFRGIAQMWVLTCKTVGCWMWWPLTNVTASAWSGVTVQTPSSHDIKQCLGWIDGPNNCKAVVFAEPTWKVNLKSLIIPNVRDATKTCCRCRCWRAERTRRRVRARGTVLTLCCYHVE